MTVVSYIEDPDVACQQGEQGIVVGLLLKQIGSLIKVRLASAFEAEGMRSLHWQALRALGQAPYRSCLALSKVLDYDTGATSRIVDELVRRGWAERFPILPTGAW